MQSILELLRRWFRGSHPASLLVRDPSLTSDLVIRNSNPTSNLERIPIKIVLPIEIILLIADYLPGVALLAFALTCCPYYRALHSRFPYLVRGDKEEFLQLLEKDTSHLYFCHYCVQLHAWKSSWYTDAGRDRFDERKCRRKYSYYAGPHHRHLFVQFHHARVVMNGHLYGPSHGPPLRTLEHYNSHVDLSYGAILQTSMNARIINDELFLLEDCKVWHRRGYGPDLRLSIDESRLKICRHLFVSKAQHCRETHIPELNRGTRNPGSFVACDASVGSCPTCLTDYSITITWRGKEEGWLIHILIYHQFGSCRSPFDWNWRHMAEMADRNQPRCLTEDKGIVKQRWSQGDNKSLEPTGKFVGRAANLRYHIPGHRRCDWGGFCRQDHDCATYGLED